MSELTTDAVTQLNAYHELSKHRFGGYAPGPETLDWDDQPSVFRHFDAAPRIELPLSAVAPPAQPAAHLFSGAGAPQPLTLATLSSFLRHAAGLTAWKVLGPDRWSLRVNPSSGNLHPSELYLLLPAGIAWDAGVYHYNVHDHVLEQRLALPAEAIRGASLVITSVLQRELWKYGERGLRYCLLDTGHLLAQCQASAALNGWRLSPHAIDHDTLSALVGIRRPEYARVEAEYPELLIQLGDATTDYARLAARARQAEHWQGSPSRLGPRPIQYWRQAEAMVQRFSRTPALNWSPAAAEMPAFDDAPAAHRVIRNRRSAQGYNHERSLSEAEFSALLRPLLPGQSRMQLTPARLHLVLLVHQVDGLEPGIYLLPRSAEGERLMQREVTHWPQRADVTLGSGLRLVHLKTCNTRKAAAQLCCNQMVAAASACTLLMLAEFEDTLAQQGAAGYQQLYYEAGVLGQALYLSATALGLNGTGIGCFFDDAVHELLGIEGHALQTLYGFALGEGKPDTRVTALSGYHHLREPHHV